MNVTVGWIDIVKELGFGIIFAGLCVWMVVTIVKNLCATMEKLNTKFTKFADRVNDEHKESGKQHENLMRQHEGIMEGLGRINGYKQ